jgi:hypothetical protein
MKRFEEPGPVPIPIIGKIHVVGIPEASAVEKDQRLSRSLIKISRFDPIDGDVLRILHDQPFSS